MTAADTLKYLEYAYDIEKNIFILENSLAESKRNYERLARPRDIKCDYLETFNMQEPVKPKHGGYSYLFVSIPMTVLGVIWARNAIKNFWALLNGSLLNFFQAPFYLIVVIISLVIPVCGIYATFAGGINNNQLYKEESAKYEKNYQEYIKTKQRIESSNARKKSDYELAQAKERTRMQNESLEKIVTGSQIEQLETYLRESKERREQFYSCGIVHPLYRNLSAVTAFNSYFSTGRCSEFAGPSGAYNLYENEKRLDTISFKLDKVIQKLDVISNNQVMIEMAVRESTDMLSHVMDDNKRLSSQIAAQNQQNQAALASKLDQLNENSYLSNYYQKRCVQELNYLAYSDYLNGNKMANPYNPMYKNMPL